MLKKILTAIFKPHTWEYSHKDDAAYPNDEESVMNYRRCSVCDKEQFLDYDGWCTEFTGLER